MTYHCPLCNKEIPDPKYVHSPQMRQEFWFWECEDCNHFGFEPKTADSYEQENVRKLKRE